MKPGRASEIRDLGDGRVLRTGGSPEREARLMRHAAMHGFPVPRIDEVTVDGLLLELVAGPTMEADLLRRPWRLGAHMRTLVRLHDTLHRIDHPDGGTLVHLDLHPENVLLSPRGPVVIDWTNARAGDPATDVALTWLILATSGGLPGRIAARSFLRACRGVDEGLHAAIAYRLADRNTLPRERVRLDRLQSGRAQHP